MTTYRAAQQIVSTYQEMFKIICTRVYLMLMSNPRNIIEQNFKTLEKTRPRREDMNISVILREYFNHLDAYKEKKSYTCYNTTDNYRNMRYHLGLSYLFMQCIGHFCINLVRVWFNINDSASLGLCISVCAHELYEYFVVNDKNDQIVFTIVDTKRKRDDNDDGTNDTAVNDNQYYREKNEYSEEQFKNFIKSHIKN